MKGIKAARRGHFPLRLPGPTPSAARTESATRALGVVSRESRSASRSKPCRTCGWGIARDRPARWPRPRTGAASSGRRSGARVCPPRSGARGRERWRRGRSTASERQPPGALAKVRADGSHERAVPSRAAAAPADLNPRGVRAPCPPRRHGRRSATSPPLQPTRVPAPHALIRAPPADASCGWNPSPPASRPARR